MAVGGAVRRSPRPVEETAVAVGGAVEETAVGETARNNGWDWHRRGHWCDSGGDWHRRGEYDTVRRDNGWDWHRRGEYRRSLRSRRWRLPTPTIATEQQSSSHKQLPAEQLPQTLTAVAVGSIASAIATEQQSSSHKQLPAEQLPQTLTAVADRIGERIASAIATATPAPASTTLAPSLLAASTTLATNHHHKFPTFGPQPPAPAMLANYGTAERPCVRPMIGGLRYSESQGMWVPY